MDTNLLGRRIRHARKAKGLTLAQLGEALGLAPSQLSLIETGKREPKLSLLQTLADQLDTEVAELMQPTAPDERNRLELDWERAQARPAFARLGVPPLGSVKTLPDQVLTVLTSLVRELERRDRRASATPEEARRANTEQRLWLRARNNVLPELDEQAEQLMAQVGHTGGALSHHAVDLLAAKLGFTLIYVDDLPDSTRSITDLRSHRIYLPPASIPGGHGLRSMALQAMAHRVLGHEVPVDYADFLHQRLEINYFAAACLMLRGPSVEFLARAQQHRALSVEDFRDAFGVTHEAAALRMTNLLTAHLDIPVHFLRVAGDGSIVKAYENDGLPLPTDVTGSVEGQPVCRHFAARQSLRRQNRTTEHHQYTDTPAGTFWCSTQTGRTAAEDFSITLGVPFDQARFFRGRDTKLRAASRCPDDPTCCRRPEQELAARWQGQSWPSARVHAHVFSPLPGGEFPGVDDQEVYEFLDRHNRS